MNDISPEELAAVVAAVDACVESDAPRVEASSAWKMAMRRESVEPFGLRKAQAPFDRLRMTRRVV